LPSFAPGYSGERGYEIFAGAKVIGAIWDEILGHGKTLGVMPCSFAALDKVRIEAALLFFGYDMTAEHTPWEVGLGFTVSRKKKNFRGRSAVFEQEGKERFLAAGIVADLGESQAGGEVLHLEGEEIGVVNSPCWSHRMGKSLSLGHVRPDAAKPGTKLEVIGEDGPVCSATVETTPFYDPEKSRVRG
jgi:aminomethyltransferase